MEPRNLQSSSGGEVELPAEPTRDRVESIFSSVAPRYDLANRVNSLGLDKGWRRDLVKLAQLRPDSRVLDLAAGTGDLTAELARLGQPRMVVATDLVAPMLELARRKLGSQLGATRLEFQVADAQRLPFADNSFDAVTIAFGVRNLPDRRAHFAEALRVLAPGGRYLVLEFSRPTLGPMRAAYHVYLRHVVPFWGGLLTGDRSAYEYLHDSILLFPSQSVFARELEAAGFSDVEWHDLTLGIVAVHVGRKPPRTASPS